MNRQQQALLIVIVCIVILLITTSMIYIRGLAEKNENLKAQNKQLKEQIKILEGDINEINRAYQEEIDRLTGEPLGDFVTTFYCPTGNRTSTGTIPKEGRTIAVDPSVIAPGSTVRIEYAGRSKIFKVEDSGVKGRVVDTFINSEKQAIKLGVKNIKVYLIKKVEK